MTWARQYAFEDSYIPEPNTGCWLWEGPVNEDGYGRYWNGSSRLGAHRHSWTANKGIIPDGMHVLHKCDQPCCVNPEHLWLGTHADNMADRTAKGRGRNNNKAGEDSHLAKLSATHVEEIRRRVASGELQKSMASEFGVSTTSICKIVNRKQWRHI